MLVKIDLRNILKNALIYNAYQKIIGGVKARKYFIENDSLIQENQKVLDIGCGPGYLIDFLPDVEYTGIDINKDYIDAAKKAYPEKNFIHSSIEKFKINQPNTYDVVVAAGVIHHLSDSQAHLLFNLAEKALKPSGWLVTLDGCYTKNQNPISRFLLKKDRGNFIRDQKEYECIAKKTFKNVNSKITENYFNVPYTSIILVCKK